MRTTTALAGILALGFALPAVAQQRDHEEHRGGPGPQMHNDRPHPGPQQQPQPHPQQQPPQPHPQPQPNVQRPQPRPGPAPAPGGAMRGSPPPAPAPQARRGPPPAPAGNRPAPQRYAPPPRPAAEARAWNQQGGWRQGAWQQHNNWDDHRSAHWQDDHRAWAQRGGYGGYYIPAPRFERRFGERHFFRLRARPVIYDGYPRFAYGGYNFLIVDPWPAYWGDAWYENDDVYIAYDGDGYYLHNRRYPDAALAVTVTM